jgi:uridine kinase
MNITLRLAPKSEAKIVDTDAPTRIDTLAESFKSQLPYDIYAARLNNRVVSLDTMLQDSCEVTFLDIRDPSGNQAYQNSVVALYLEAVKRVFPKAAVTIEHSLNRGIFTTVSMGRPTTSVDALAIEHRMKKLVEEDISFWEIDPDLQLVAPSTKYVKTFDLKKCRNGIVVRIAEPSHPDSLASYRDDKKLHKAFSIQAKWDQMLGIRYMEDLNDMIKTGEIMDIIQTSEALHEKSIAGIADRIVKEKKRIVLIAGPSSSGKTTFAHRLCTQLWVNGAKPIYLGTDDYYIDRNLLPFEADGTQNFENLDSLDVELFNQHMNALLAGEEVDIPRFDFGLGKKVFGKRLMKASANQPIVIEGIHGLNEKLTAQIPGKEKFKIYISPLTQVRIDNHNRVPLTDVRKLRRIVRDASYRGWDAKKTIEAWPKVRAGEDINIFPYSMEADAFFNSVHVYELAVIKKYVRPLLEEIPPEDETYTEAQRLLRLLSFVSEIKDDTIIANNSIIREFIGGSSIFMGAFE